MNKHIELVKKVEMDERIAELETALQERTEYVNKLANDVQEDQKAFALEQQAKGIDMVLELQAYSCMNESAIMAQDIHGLLVSLRNQAKQAKEKG